MKEKRVEDHLIRRVAETGGFTRKVQWIGRKGAPDRLCGWPQFKRFGMPELKKPTTPTAEAHQKREHERLRSIGIQVDVLATIEDVDRYVEEMTRA
jgi:hypothetical protein